MLANQNEFLGAMTKRAKAEIRYDVGRGMVSANVGSFAELHDFVDANCYAGCCEDSTMEGLRGLDLWNTIFPKQTDSDDEVLGSEATLDAMNEMQNELDVWLRVGGHRANLSEVPVDELPSVP